VFEDLIGLGRYDLLGGTMQEVLPAGLGDSLSEGDLGAVGEQRRLDVAFRDGKGVERKGVLIATAFEDPHGRTAGLVLSLGVGNCRPLA
jgi:hypothetical protein